MENDSEQLIEQHMQQWAQYLLAGDIFSSFQTDTNTNYANHQSLSLKSQPQRQFFPIGHFVNPFFVPLTHKPKEQTHLQSLIHQCIENSQNNQNLSLLLNSVEQLPKLRYQQSSKIFSNQHLPLPNQTIKSQAVTPNQKHLTFQASSAKSFQPISKNLNKTEVSQRFPQLKTADSKSKSKFILKQPSNHKVIDLQGNSNEEQNDIDAYMSVKSFHEVNPTMEDGDEQNHSVHSNFGRKGKIFVKGQSYQKAMQSQSEKKVKEEKHMIQNYFESAKNRVFQNFSLNCCEGMFQSGESPHDKKSGKMIKLNFGQQQTLKSRKKN